MGLFDRLRGSRGERASGDAAAEAGQRLFQQRQFAKAIRSFDRALQKPLKDWSRSDVLASIGNCYRELDQFKRALEFHEKALQQDPKNHSALVGMGAVYRQNGDYDQASDCYSKALELAPDFAELHTNIGVLCIFQDKYEESIPHLERAVRLNEALAVAHANLAVGYAGVGRFGDAESQLRKAVLHGYHQSEVVKTRIQQLRRVTDTTADAGAERRAYLISLWDTKPWSSVELGQIVAQKSAELGCPAELLESVRVSGPFPTEPDAYVVATALQACKAAGIPFDSERDNISFSGGVYRPGEGLGLITIELNQDRSQGPSVTKS